MADITRILSAIEHGDPTGAEQLLPLVHEELRRPDSKQLVIHFARVGETEPLVSIN